MRMLRAAMLALTALGVVMSSSTMQAAGGPVVHTAQGKAQGKLLAEGKVKAFLGLPYAAPPVGGLRWRAPQPAAAWKGVRQAASFGPHCAQLHVFDDMIFQDGAGIGSEDCLYLNVYAPAHANGKLPVMVWVHGGGYSGGAASEPRHNGDFLPQMGVVLVTINYRLGVFGFLGASDLDHEQGGSAGNYGLMDMIAALQWVKQNIAGFGGDAGNVTIFGESAGSFAVSSLMASPLARGLFHKAIGESGSALPREGASLTLAAGLKRGDDWLDGIGVKSIAELRGWETDKILNAAKGKVSGMPVYVDGKVFTEPVEATYAAGRQAHVPLLAGWNRDEGSFVAKGINAAKWKQMVAGMFKERAEKALEFYPAGSDEEAVRSAIDYSGDAFIVHVSWKWLDAHRRTGEAPVYRYHLELAAPPSKFHPGSYAFHSDDIEYVFGTLDTRPGAQWRPEDRKLSAQMMAYWTNFAKSGDPNGPGLPVWPMSGAKEELIHLDSTITSGPDILRPRYEFLLEGVPAVKM